MAKKGIAFLAAVFVAAGCGSATSHSTTRALPDPSLVTPRQVERIFSVHGVRLVPNFPNARPGPIVRADYRIGGGRPNGWVTVFDSVHDAAVAEQRSRKAYGQRNLVVKANVLVEFLRYADAAAREQVTHALSAVAR